MASEPQLANLSSEPANKYYQYTGVNAQASPIRCGILKLDAIFNSNNSETIGFALYSYAHLVQRIFYLSNPTTSKSTQTWLPNTFAEFKTSMQNNQAKYLQKLKELIGYGTTGFAHNVAEQSRYGLFMVFDTQYNTLVSGHLLVVKSVRTSPTTTRLVTEIWGVAADPLYMKSGAGASLLLGTLDLAINIVDELYEHTRGLDENIIANNLTIELEVAKDSFPFIDFMDRFTFYARNGFSYASGGISSLDASDVVHNVDLSRYEFNSEYLLGNSVSFVRDLASNATLSLDDWKKMYAVSLPNTTQLILFRTKLISAFDSDKTKRDFSIVFNKIKRSTFNQTIPYQACWLSHSAYIPTAEGNLTTFKVPANVEIIIMNSPGYSTTLGTVPKNWNLNTKYLRNVPMDYIQKLFPPFKTVQKHGVQVVPLESRNAFTYATSGGVLLNVTNRDYTDYQEYIQIHCYNAGDLCPDMRMTCKLGNTDDFVASMFGLYNISLPEGYISLKMTNDVSTLNAMEGRLFNPTTDYMHQLNELGVVWPNQKYRSFPTKSYLQNKGYTNTSSKSFSGTLRNLSALFKSENKIRLCILSCANIDDEIDNYIKQAWSVRLNHTLKVDLLDYEKRINKLGEAIYDIYNANVSAYGLSD
jgi:hypothetical protein